MADSRATLQKRVELRDSQIEELRNQLRACRVTYASILERHKEGMADFKEQVKIAQAYVEGLETENGDLRRDIRDRRKAKNKLQKELGGLESELCSVLHQCCVVLEERRWTAGPKKRYVLSRLMELARGGAKIRRLSAQRGEKVETTGRALEMVRLLAE